METFRINLFKDSVKPFVGLLDEHGVKHSYQDPRAGAFMAAGFVYEVLREPAMWAALSGVVGAFLGRRTGRKVIITMKDGSAVHAEGLPPKELAKVLEQAKSMLAIDVNVDNTKGDDVSDASAKEKPRG